MSPWQSMFLVLFSLTFVRAQKCFDPGRPPFGFRIGSDFNRGQSVSYRCRPGYKLIGSEKSICICLGVTCSWRPPPSKCILSCDDPGNVADGRILGSPGVFSPNVRIQYRCDSGHRLNGSSYSVCRCFGSSCRWIPPPPQCNQIECPPPGNVTHGQVVSDDFRPDRWISFQCFAGFRVNGSSHAICRCINNTCFWSAPTPSCVVLACNDPGPLANGTRSGPRNYTAGGYIDYSCNRPLHIVGSTRSTCYCLPHVCHWIPAKPACTAGCKKPRISHCQVHGRDYSPGGTVLFRCHDGYRQQGSTQSTCECQGSDCRWTHSPPKCIRLRCRKPPKPNHGYKRGRVFDVGQRVQFVCHDGFMLKGPREIACVCSERKCTWKSSSIPECVRAVCPDPRPLKHGRVLGDHFGEGRSISYECYRPYVLDPPLKISVCQCDRDRTTCDWVPPKPKCEFKACSKPVIPNGEVVGEQSFSCGQRVAFVCRDGYEIVGSSFSTCHCYGFVWRWSPVLPECIPVKCEPPPLVPFSNKEDTGAEVGDTVEYECWYTYEIRGSSRRVCQADGTWNGTLPTCSRV